MTRGARASSHDLVERVLRENAPDLLKYFLRRVDDREDAADLLSETMLVVWRRAPRLPADPGEARMWMYGIAANVLRNARRTLRRRSALADRLRGDVSRAPRSDDSDLRLDVERALETLTEPDRDLVRLLHWDGFTLAQAAAHLGMNASTTRTRYARARARLAEVLGVDHLPTPAAEAAPSTVGASGEAFDGR